MQECDRSDSATRRDVGLDAARGFAVLAMVWVHFVPEPEVHEGAQPDGVLAWLQWASVACLDGLPAAMFLLLVGVAAAISGAPDARYVWRRAATLGAIGFAFWHFVWPNDILMPIALMLPLLAAVHGKRRGVLVSLVLTLLICVPVVTHLWGDYAWRDVREDGTHMANHATGWFTLRYFVIDGAYPLLPWFVFPLLGNLLASVRDNVRALCWCIGAGIALAVAALVVSQLWGDAYEGGLYAHLDVTWQPTSLPFVALWGGAALALVARLLLWSKRGALPGWLSQVAAVGQVSLTHYLLHLVVVYQILKVWWPAEDWSSLVGVSAALGYFAFALLVTPRWLASRRKGPIEALLARCSGARRA